VGGLLLADTFFHAGANREAILALVAERGTPVAIER
jgi:hypothetical protein